MMNKVYSKNKYSLKNLFKKYFVIPFLIIFIPFLFAFLVKLKDHEDVGDFLLDGAAAIFLISLAIAFFILKLWLYKRDNK